MMIAPVLIAISAIANPIVPDAKGEFVAMEFRGVSNLIYKVIVTDDRIIGIKVSGYISVANPLGIGRTIPRDKLYDPQAYIDERLESKYANLDLESDAFLSLDRENFLIYKKDISKYFFTPTTHWGMGYYPHHGRIIIESRKTNQNSRKSRDMILMGTQDEQPILEMMK